MPGSDSKNEVEAKDDKANSPTQPTRLKPILKEPSFGLPPKQSSTSNDVAPETAANTAANINPSGVEPPTNTPKLPAADHVEDAQLGEKTPAQPITTVQS